MPCTRKQYAKSFIAEARIDSAYETTQRFLIARGFKITKAQKPSTIIGERGTKVGSYFSFRIEEVFQTLAINFHQTDDGVRVACKYELEAYGLITSKDRMYLDKEMEMLVANVNSVHP